MSDLENNVNLIVDVTKPVVDNVVVPILDKKIEADKHRFDIQADIYKSEQERRKNKDDNKTIRKIEKYKKDAYIATITAKKDIEKQKLKNKKEIKKSQEKTTRTAIKTLDNMSERSENADSLEINNLMNLIDSVQEKISTCDSNDWERIAVLQGQLKSLNDKLTTAQKKQLFTRVIDRTTLVKITNSKTNSNLEIEDKSDYGNS